MAAIYQRARPTTFADVIGQAHVKDVLAAAVRSGRTGHAYLFSGPRGVGKTTTARLLAMAVNCDGDGEARPCGECESCRLVRGNTHPDVIELDAASNNSVEDVRELREKVRLASIRGGVRVWILDEAHMLSRAASNALLKTLEEPPDNLVFVLATTEPEKLPPTILSRCQHFRFRRLSEDEIRGKLARLCREAGVEADEEALALVARAADGAMRDAESLLERLLTAGGPIGRAEAEDALGLPPAERMEALASALAKRELAPLLELAAGLYRDGFAPRSLAAHLGVTLRDALEREVTGGEGFRTGLEQDDLLRLLHALDDEAERFVRRDDLYSLEVSLIKAMNALSGNVPAAAAAGAVAGTPAPSGAPAAAPAAKAPAAAATAGPALPAFDPHSAPPRREEKAAAAPAATGRDGEGEAAPAPATTPAATPAAAATLSWHAVKTKAGPQLKAFLMPAREEIEGDRLTIHFGETHRFHYTQLLQRESELVALVEEVGGPGWRVSIVCEGGKERKKR